MAALSSPSEGSLDGGSDEGAAGHGTQPERRNIATSWYDQGNIHAYRLNRQNNSYEYYRGVVLPASTTNTRR